MIKEYDKCKEQIQELIDIANLEKERLHIITIFDNPYQTDALSGMIYPIEIEDIEAGFLCSAEKYTGYMDYKLFEKDLSTEIFADPNIKYCVYNTSQQGIGICRRNYVPMLCEKYQLHNLTCNAYTLSLLMNKAHYFSLLQPFGHIPKTDIFTNYGLCFKSVNSQYVILKPALECAAVGVKKMENDTLSIIDELRAMRDKYNQDIILQEYISGYEVSVPVIRKGDNLIALPPVWVKFNEDILTYSSVDNFEYSFSVLPDKEFPYNEVISALISHASQIMAYINSDGLTRVDYRIKNSKDFYVFDIAALPILANTGTCMQSFKYLFGEKESLFKAIIGSVLY